MRTLAIDTSFEACSAAILDGDRIAWTKTEIIGRGHSEVLPVMVAEGLAATGFRVGDLDRVGVVVGPGAFAGVRVGIAFARGLCLGTGVRAVGVSSLKALAASVAGGELIATAFDARRGQVYAALYGKLLRELIAPFVAAPEEAAARLSAGAGAKITLAGSGAVLIAPHFDRPFDMSATGHIDPVALARLAASAELSNSPPAPLYLRPPDAAPSAGGLFRESESA